MKLNHPPKADQIEVTLIGPGKGECALVHLDCKFCYNDKMRFEAAEKCKARNKGGGYCFARAS